MLKEQYGNFDSILEHEYEDKLTNILLTGTINEKKAWVTYNQVILELKTTPNNDIKIKELQYKLTENGNPNDICIEVIKTLINKTPELERLYNKIVNF